MEYQARGVKLGIIGGTFNPIHFGHLRAVEEVFEGLHLDQLAFIPAARPPHKAPSPLIEFQYRLAMVEMAIADRPGFFATDLEGKRTGPSYTIETLRHYQRVFADPAAEIFFITGLDAFLEIHTWKEFRQLLRLASFVVITRPKYDQGGLRSYIEKYLSPEIRWHEETGTFTGPGIEPIYYLPVTGFDVSSTDIRRRVGQGRSIRYLTPEPVRRYIMSHGLYQDGFKPENPAGAYGRTRCRRHAS